MRYTLFALLLTLSTLSASAQVLGSGQCYSNDSTTTGRGVVLVSQLSNIQPPFTLSAWVRIDSVIGIQPIFSSAILTQIGGYGSWSVFFETQPDGTVELVSGLGDIWGTTNRGYMQLRAPVNGIHNDWMHISVTMDSANYGLISINGIHTPSYTVGHVNSLRTHLNATSSIGLYSDSTGGYYLSGDIDELRVWNRRISDTERKNYMCQRLIGTEPGLELYYTFDEQGGTLVDHSPYQRNGRLFSSAHLHPSSAPVGDTSVFRYTFGSVWIDNGEGDTLFADHPGLSPFNTGVHIYHSKGNPDIWPIANTTCDSSGIFGRFMAALPGVNNLSGNFRFYPVPGHIALRDTANSGRWFTDSLFSPFGSAELFLEWYLFTRFPSQPDLGPDSAFCMNDTVTLGMSDWWWNNASNVKNMLWSDGSTDSTLDATQPGDYWVEVFSGYCSTSDSISLFQIPEADSLYQDTLEICTETGGLLRIPEYYPASFVKDVLWNTGETSNQIFVRDVGTYTAQVTSDCQTFYLLFEVGNKPECGPQNLSIPNVFSPNGDGINDVLEIQTEGFHSYSIQIFNRWGTLVYNGNEYSSPWDGTFQSQRVPEGVYFCTFSGTTFQNETITEQETIHVIY